MFWVKIRGFCLLLFAEGSRIAGDVAIAGGHNGPDSGFGGRL